MGWRGVSVGQGGEERGSGDLGMELDDGYLIYGCHDGAMVSIWALQRFISMRQARIQSVAGRGWGGRCSPTSITARADLSEDPKVQHQKFLDCGQRLHIAIMALHQRAPYQTADAQRIGQDESDQEEDALVNDYKEQVHFDDGLNELDRVPSLGGGGGQLQDMQAQLVAAATPLEYQATLETKFASYDNYCNLFHYILNSDGPVDLEVPSVSLYLHKYY